MSEPYLDPPEHIKRPRLTPPPGATDCHAHVFGPFARFPLLADRSYSPPELPVERYLGMLDCLGFSRGVLVQPTAHGTDCRAMLNALDTADGRLRGVCVVTPDVTDRELEHMHRHGVRGARFSQPRETHFRGWVGFDALNALAPRLRSLGWHAQIWAPCNLLVSALPELLTLDLPLVVDHMAYFDVSRGLSDPYFQAIVKLVGEGRIWLKLGSFRLSARYPDYEDVVPFHRALLAANPHRLVWGSDWPYVHMRRHIPDAGHLVDLFDNWTPEDPPRRLILADNPAALYGW